MKQPYLPFGGFFVGPVAAAVLLAYGVQLLVATVLDPLAALVVDSLNFVIRTGGFGATPLPSWQFSLILTAYTGVGGTAALLIGLRLAAWVAERKTQVP